MLFYWTQLSKYPNNFVLKKSVTTYLNRIKPQIKKKKKKTHMSIYCMIYMIQQNDMTLTIYPYDANFLYMM